ncbi:hypothetical protein ACLBKU_09835 [Erythrobacter sp. NE805]|uniref:hypothetical protein n=1 Tax=Erythrobacter sp. NE805 TaxID=3389875 RepID=UPI00396B183B
MARRRRRHEWADHPELLTSIRTPWDKYQKADWNFARYEDEVFKRPCNAENVCFTALDFCVALTSLRDWTRVSLARDIRAGLRQLPIGLAGLSEFDAFARQLIPWMFAVEAIANTTKHAEYRDTGWPRGIAMPHTFVPINLKEEHDNCRDGLDLFAFMHRHKDVAWWDVALRQQGDEEATPGYIAFGDALEGWEQVLTTLGYRPAD